MLLKSFRSDPHLQEIMSENFAVFQESKQEPLQNAVSVTRMEIPANSQKHVFVKFLPLHYTEEMFRLLGSKFGTLVCLKLIVEPQSGHCMGCMFSLCCLFFKL